MQNLGGFSADERVFIARAHAFAEQAHATQRRISGEPYITHPVAVAHLLISEFGADADLVAAGLLHDTVEDTTATLADIKREFGDAVHFLVDGATDVGRGDGHPAIEDRTQRDEATHAKILEYAKTDPRLVHLKCADRWHNLLHCRVLRAKNQHRLATETLQFHLPLLRAQGFTSQADAIREVCDDVLRYVAQANEDAAHRRHYFR